MFRIMQLGVPEHTFGLILNLARSFESYRKDVVNGLWQNSTSFSLLNHPIKDLNKKT